MKDAMPSVAATATIDHFRRAANISISGHAR
jgi:hypothetical protein